jgi:phosphoglycerol transferase MdoB-like AlkP superfamily enzyme
MSKFEIVLILGLALVAIGGLVSAKLKHNNRRIWWLPIAICGSLLVLLIALYVWLIIDFMNAPLCV